MSAGLQLAIGLRSAQPEFLCRSFHRRLSFHTFCDQFLDPITKCRLLGLRCVFPRALYDKNELAFRACTGSSGGKLAQRSANDLFV